MFYRLQQYQSVQWIIIHIRYLMALAFVPSGFTKLVGERFTRLPPSEAVGRFFEAMYQSGMYYHFLGLAQIVTAILLMTQRFALIGTFLFLGIATNIWMITLSLPFKGTWVITSLMMFAGCVLVYWDKNRVTAFYTDCDLLSKKYAPGVSKLWINAGIIYITSLLVLCYTGPKTAPVSKGIAIIVYFILGLTFLYTNFVFWKKSDTIVTSQNVL